MSTVMIVVARGRSFGSILVQVIYYTMIFTALVENHQNKQISFSPRSHVINQSINRQSTLLTTLCFSFYHERTTYDRIPNEIGPRFVNWESR